MQRSLSEPEKKIVAARQGWRCSACNNLLPSAYQVDHTIALWAGGEDHISNCTAMCGNCHNEKTQLETIERYKKASAAAPTYEDRVDIFVAKNRVKCSLCHRERDASHGHDVCLSIESPHLQSSALQNRLSQYAFVPRHLKAGRSQIRAPLLSPPLQQPPERPGPPSQTPPSFQTQRTHHSPTAPPARAPQSLHCTPEA